MTIESDSFFKGESASKFAVLDENTYKIDVLDKVLYRNYIEQNKARIIDMNKKLVNGLSEIREKMTLLLEENSRNPEIRKLEQEDFLINVEFRKKLEQKMLQDVKNLRYQSKINNLKKEAEKFLILK